MSKWCMLPLKALRLMHPTFPVIHSFIKIRASRCLCMFSLTVKANIKIHNPETSQCESLPNTAKVPASCLKDMFTKPQFHHLLLLLQSYVLVMKFERNA